jgi:uncharacterized phage protein (TIGR01671 family)
MRPIKFRGWHTTQKKMYSAEEMAEDQLTLLPTGQFINVSGKSTRLSTIFPSDKFIPLQFTGLHDKNGKEIYEGDILRPQEGMIRFYDNHIWVIVFSKKRCGFGLVTTKNYPSFCNGLCDGTVNMSHNREIFEVIGNIHKNPELLEAQ